MSAHVPRVWSLYEPILIMEYSVRIGATNDNGPYRALWLLGGWDKGAKLA